VLSGEPVRLGSVDVVMVSEIARFFLDFLPWPVFAEYQITHTHITNAYLYQLNISISHNSRKAE
jgi:hypothetical protein